LAAEIQAIGVPNGGGDCPGLNAVIRGGTIHGRTNRGNPFHYALQEDGKTLTHDLPPVCCDNMRQLGLDALVVIGVPETIDNDHSSTEVTFGFDTALHVATDAIDRLHMTAASHGRVMVIEVMGRDAGWIALHSGIAGGADVILILEIPFTLETVCEKIREREDAGRKFSLVVVAEGVKLPATDPWGKPFPPHRPGQVGILIGEAICSILNKDVRITVLGHIQRGGSPSPFDRILSTRFGIEAVELIARGNFGRMVCLRAGEIESVPLDEAVGSTRLVNPESSVVRAARAVGITFGDPS
jgi:6-phosphofructokinase